MIFNDFFSSFGDFGHFWGILGPFLGQILGEVGRWLPTSDLYKPGLLEAMEEVQSRFMLNIFQAKAIFMQGSC
jgi:hypothetical protein